LQQSSRRLAWTSAVIHGLVHASVLLLPPLLGDLQRAFGVSLLRLLAVGNAMYLVYGLAAIPAGFLADRFGSRRMLVVAASGCGLSLLLIAGAPSFPLLAVGLVALGLSAGVYHPSGLSLLSRGVASGERGRAIGIHGAGGNLGEAVAPAWAAAFATAIHWRAGFAVGALLSFACALLASTLPAARAAEGYHSHGPGPAHSHGPPGGALGRTPHSHAPAGGLPLAWGATWRALGHTLLEFARNRPLRWLLLSLVAVGFTYRGFLTFLPLHLSPGSGGAASYVMSAVLLVGMIAQRYGGELADRRARERLYLALSLLALPVLLLLALTSGGTAIAAALAYGFVWALAQPVANALTATYARSTDHGLLYGIQFAATFGVGSFATTAGGFLLAAGGTRLAFLGLTCATLLGIVAVFALLRAASQAPESAAPVR
jgi:MFS family permease